MRFAPIHLSYRPALPVLANIVICAFVMITWIIWTSRGILLIYVFLIVFGSIESKCSKFIDKFYRDDQWPTVQAHVDCLTHQGSWQTQANAYKPHCFEELSQSCSQAANNPSLNYAWKVTNCSYRPEPFDVRSLCTMLNGKTIMFVGDSITLQFGTAMLNAVYDHVPYQCNPDLTFFTTGMYEIKCPSNIKNFRLQIVRNDRLSLVLRKAVNTNNFTRQNKFIEFTWLPLINIIQPAILVLNRGAHFENTSVVLDSLREAFSYVYEHHPNTTVIWRNTPRGVEDHKEEFFNLPLKEPLDPRAPSIYPYAYEQYHDQNIAIREFLEKEFPKAIFWDIAHAMSFRQDGHRDPLHYCLPGPMDTWPWFLYNILTTIRNSVRMFSSLENCLVS
jgi:hypothetical protein